MGSTNGSAILLTVVYPPEVTYSKKVFGGNVGTSLTVTCTLDAKPAVSSVSWWRINSTDGSKSLISLTAIAGRYSGGTTTTPSLTINNLTAADAGFYRCGADNDVGSGEGDNVEVQVFYAPAVTVSATSYVRNETDTLVITCSYDANPAPFNVTWTKNSQSVDVAGSGGKYSGATVATPSLTVTRLARSDAGVYVCSVTNTLGTGHSRDVTVQVNYLPIVSTPVTYYNGSRGGSVTMKCEVTASPAPTGISWYKDGSLLVTSGSGVKYSGGTTSTPDLTINSLAGNDTGKYICKAANNLGSTESSNITLEVTYAPIVKLSATSYTKNETETLVITCSYDANPAPFNVTWTRNSQSVDVAGSGGKYGGATVAIPSLTVTRLARSDAGVYVCSVTNILGTGHSPDVTVQVNYSPVVNTPVTYYNGSRGGSVTMKCEVTANPAPTGISWYKDGSLLVTSGSGAKYSGGTTSTPDLTINSLAGNDTGKYICKAVNSLGSTESSNITLEVIYAPIVTLSATSYTKNETETLVITCSYEANPAAFNVTWTRNSQSVDVAGSSGKYGGATVATPSLTVTRLARSDAGVYVCSVTNTLGTGHSPDVTVQVNYSPVVNTPVAYYNGSRGGSVTMKCEVTANPAPTGISWYKDGSPLVTSGSGGKYSGGTTSTPDLTVNTLSGNDTGSYLCTAINSLGSANGTDIRLEVTYAPLITSSSAPLTGTELSPLTLPCTYDANPSPTRVLWTKNSVNITLPSSPYTGGTPGTPSLTIVSLTLEDTGSYACTVVNSLGNTSSGAILVTVQYAPKVDSGPGGLRTTPTGQNVTIPCNVSAVPTVTSVTWLRDGAVLSVNNGAKYSGGTVSTPALTIRNVVRSDAATYTCRVTNAVGTREGTNVTLVVQYKPVVKVPEFISGNESQVVTISCDVTALPEVMSLGWKKDGQLLNTTSSDRYSGGNVTSPSLTLNSLGAEDVGNYSCVADNSVGSTESASVLLSVHYSPIFTVPLTEVGGVEGQAVTLSVSIKANPEVTTLRWYRFDAASSVWSQIDVVSTSKYSGGTTSRPSLTISTLDSGDWGDYQAEASNVINTRRSLTIRVAVSYKPTSPNITGNASSYKEGEAIVLTCMANGFPTPRYDWYRDSIVYQQNDSVLNISSASPADNTKFKCRAVNSLGYSETSISIVVEYKPRPSSTLTNTTADIGQSVTLSCDVDSNPAPTNYTWFFNGSVVSTGSKTLEVTVETSSLGIYTCIASNRQGDSNPVDIVVTQNTATDSPKTGESTEAGGLSVATMVLIIIICVIVALVVVLAIVYFCSGSRCTRKKNEVRQAPADAPVTFPEVKPGKNRLPPLRSAPPPSTAPPPTAASPTRGKVSVDDEHPALSNAPKEDSRLGNGVIISMPGGVGGAPRPYRLRPLNTAGVGAGEVEPATDRVDEPTRKTTKKKRKRKLQLAEEDPTSEAVSHQSLDRLLQNEDDSVDV
ncbi:hemicentin-1-like isoform X2 [Pomacea canaliculata]|uniref:hemicentin-1-like isoform X2 n=1 Tax=Pomacea canaliculata TaxID=400727 RepID=UPI000D731E6A|nr:hemicentin-1-like isoform X2 [Pomacea canaliculata]